MKKIVLTLAGAINLLAVEAQVSQWTQLFPPVSGKTYNRLAYVKQNSVMEETSICSMGFTQHTSTGGPNPTVTPSITYPRNIYNGTLYDITPITNFRATGCDYFPDPNYNPYNDESWFSGQIHAGGIPAKYTIGAIYKRQSADAFTQIRSLANRPYSDLSINKKFGGNDICAVGKTASATFNPNFQQKAFLSGSKDNGATWTDYVHNTTNLSVLHAVKFASQNVVYAVGAVGTDPSMDDGIYTPLLLKSTDTTDTWQEIVVNISGLGALHNLFALNETTLWIVGAGGKIIYTDDGGATWFEQTSGTTNDLHSVFFTNNQKGWAAGNAGTIIKTTDGGQTWSSSAINTTSLLSAIAFVDDTTGIVQAGNGEIFKYTPCQTSSGTDVQITCGSLTWLDGNTYTTNNNTATYLITAGASSGCDSIVTLNLTIINQPATGTDVQTACGSLTWINGNTYSADNNTATHTIVGGAINGCDSIVTLNLTVTPDVNNSVTQADPILTANQSGVNYQWVDCNNSNTPINGETGQSFEATVSGSYAVIVTDGPCSETSACFNVVITGISETTLTKFIIHPNPAQNVLNIQSDEVMSINIIGLTGEIIRTLKIEAGTNTIDLSGLAPGMYSLHSDNGISARFVKN